jgi:hypothetical protein
MTVLIHVLTRTATFTLLFLGWGRFGDTLPKTAQRLHNAFQLAVIRLAQVSTRLAGGAILLLYWIGL